jgi:hypothetical protein
VDIPAGELTKVIDGLGAFVEAYVQPVINGKPDKSHPLPVKDATSAKGLKHDIERAIEVLTEAREKRRSVETLQRLGHQASQVLSRHGRRRAR